MKKWIVFLGILAALAAVVWKLLLAGQDDHRPMTEDFEN
jgi:hypothetical protein